jgi:autoinducer 2 (AI-2) kinase
MSNYLMSLDIGGGSGRCLLVNTDTGEATVRQARWSHPTVGDGWGADLDTGLIWRTLARLTRETLAAAGADPAAVAGVAATSMRHGMVIIGHNGDPLLAVPNRDARASSEGMALAAERGPEFYRRTGHWPGPVLPGVRLAWLRKNHPGMLDQAQAFFSISDWVGYLLSGTVAAERSQAAESMLLDLASCDWASDLIESLQLPGHIFPRLVDAGTPLGGLGEAAAEHLGLPAGIMVAAGGGDTQCGLLGSGVVSSGQLGIVAGTTTPLQMVVDAPLIDEKARVWTGLHVVPGRYALESNAGSMGDALDWIARVLYAGLPNPAGALCAEAAAAAPGAEGILSTAGAQVFNASEMGLPVENLTFSSVHSAGEGDRARVARAVLEGMAFGVRANADQILSTAGIAPDRAWVCGGMSRSAAWTQMVSDVLGWQIAVAPTPEASSLGAAICAGVGAGVFADLPSGAAALAAPCREHAPDDRQRIFYRELYRDWTAIREEQAGANLAASSLIIEAMSAAKQGERAAGGAAFRPRIYVSAQVDGEALDRLRDLGDVTYASYREVGAMLVGDDLIETLQGYQIFVTEIDIVDAGALARLPDLRMVVVCRGNPVNIDIEACTVAGVPVVNTPGRNADAVADLAVNFMLMLARRLPVAAAFLFEPGGEAGDMGRMGMAYEQFQGFELWRKTVGIVGGGAIGRKVIRRLLPFEARILLYDPYLNAEQAALLGAAMVSLEDLLRQSDIISLHAPVTDETQGMIGAEAFGMMKEGAFLVNTARAALVDEAALIDALEAGKLAGAALDVFPVEPPGADDPLLRFPNVIATPHIGGNTSEVAAHQGVMIVEAVQRLLGGKTPNHLLNPGVLAGFAWTGERRVSHAALQEALRELAAKPGPGVSDLDVAAREKQAEVKREPAAPPAAEPARKGGLLGGLRRALGKSAPDQAPEPPAAAPAGGGSAEMMRKIMAAFCAAIATDPAMVEFAQGKDVVFLFTVKDLGQDFYLSFADGVVTTGLGDAPREPDVRLKMTADTLDGMFTGRINATKAAMTGKLSFSGDTGKAMAFQRIQKGMQVHYQTARDAVGDPGDLTALGAGAAVAQAPAGQAPAGQAPAAQVPAGQAPAVVVAAASPVIRVGDVRDDILAVLNELYAKGMITPTGGNISARLDNNPDEIWITPSAIFKGDLQPDMMVRIDLNGKLLDEDSYSASSERRVHCAIYRARPEIQAVVHSHAPQATLMALTGTRFLPISTEAAFLGDIPVVPFIMPGTDELGEEVARAMGKDGTAVLMQNHGLVVAGSSLRRAADMTDVIEVTAEKLLTCRALGVTPPVLPDEVVAQLREMGAMMA